MTGMDLEDSTALLLRAADTDDEAVLQLVNRVGYPVVLDRMFHEILLDLRILDDLRQDRITIRYDIGTGAHTHTYTIRLDAQGIKVTEFPWQPSGPPPITSDVDIHLSHRWSEFLDLYRSVFGPAAARRGHLRVAEMLTASTRRSPINWTALLGERAERFSELDWLANHFGTDKWGEHWYTKHYDSLFRHLRDQPITLVEIGIGGYQDPSQGGSSLEMWKRYFPRGTIYGIDIDDKSKLCSQRVYTVQGNQSDTEFLDDLITSIGPIDVVIDDGSHVCADQIATFKHLIPHVRMGGYYAIEDLQTSYWPAFGGTSTDFNTTKTGVGYLKSLVDGLNYEDLLSDTSYEGRYTDHTITAIHFFHSLAILQKGLNEESGMGTRMSDSLKRG